MKLIKKLLCVLFGILLIFFSLPVQATEFHSFDEGFYDFFYVMMGREEDTEAYSEIYDETNYDEEVSGTGWVLQRIVISNAVYPDRTAYIPTEEKTETKRWITYSDIGPDGGKLVHDLWEGAAEITLSAPGRIITSPNDFVFTVDNYGPNAASTINMYVFEGDYFWGADSPYQKSGETTETELGDNFYLYDYKDGTYEFYFDVIGDSFPTKHHNTTFDLSRIVPKEPSDGQQYSVVLGSAYIDIEYHYIYGSHQLVQNATTEASNDTGWDEGKDINSEIVDPGEDIDGDDTGSSSSNSTTGGNEGNGDNDVSKLWNEIKDRLTDPDNSEKIVISLGGAVVAGAITLGSKSGGKDKSEKNEEKKKKKKRYKMYVYKGFGDAIRKGAPPVQVYARIVEIEDGREENRPDLSEKITVSGNGLNASEGGVVNTYKCANVSAVPANGNMGTLTFTFTGEGGVFNRNIIFRLVGDPRIVFPGETADGTGWVENAGLDTVNMVAGMGGRTRLRFVFVDALVEPKDIDFADTEGFVVQPIKDTKVAFTYYADITNNTPEAEKEGGIFADPKDRDITIIATFPDGLIVNSSFRIKLWPGEISVPIADSRNGALFVDTSPDKNAGEGYSEIAPAGFEVYVCYVEGNGEAVILENPTLSFGKINDSGRYENLFSTNFSYHIGRTGSAGFLFFPEVTLPILKDPYSAMLPVSYSKDRDYKAELPLAISGIAPEPQTTELKIAYERLQRVVAILGLGNEPELRALVRNVDRHSVYEIEYVTRCVFYAGRAFYQKERLDYASLDAVFTRYIVVAGTLVKVCDYAVELYMTKRFGGYGKLAAKFGTPFKDMLLAYIGQYIGPGSEWDGHYEDMPLLKTVLQSCDEALSAAITGVFFGDDHLSKSTDFIMKIGGNAVKFTSKATDDIQKAIGYIIAAYLMVSFIEHYYGTKGDGKAKGDVYRSILAAFGDLCYESLKAWVLSRLAKIAKPMMEKIGALCGGIYRKACQAKINEEAWKAGQKMLDEKLRQGLKDDGYMITLSQEAYKAAQDARYDAYMDAFMSKNKVIDEQIEKLVEMLGAAGSSISRTNIRSIILGQIMNYAAGGKSDTNDTLGLDAKEVGFEIISKWLSSILGVTVSKISECKQTLDSLDVDVRLENEMIKIDVLGYTAEISITENINKMSDSVIDWLLSWFRDIVNALKTPFYDDSIPDPRNQQPTDVDSIQNQLEKQKQRVENMPDIKYHSDDN